jgi:Tfp pilus assembly protein PilP
MKKIILFFILCLLLPLGGCKKETDTIKKTRVKRVQQVEAKKVVKTSVKIKDVFKEKFYAYDLQGRRDPFLSLVEITKKKTERKKGASPIESFSVEEIKLLAIASDQKSAYALIQLPNQKTFTIKEGVVLGLEGGKVEEISADRVVIREYVKNFRGEIKPKDTILKLHKREE